MFVLDQGTGPAVVLVPGLGCDHTMYAPQLAELTEFRSLAVDLRGCGASPSLDGVSASEVLAVQADDIVTMLEGRGIDRAHLVGISYGGPVIETVMLRRPDLVASAVICDSLCDTRPRGPAERILMWPARMQPAMIRALPARWLAATVRPAYRRWPAAGEAMARTFRDARVDDLVTQRRAVNAVALEDALRTCTVPTLCLVGDHSSLAVSMMRRVHEALPNSEFHVIPDSFDPSSLCRPEAFTAHVRTWVLRQESPA